MNRDIKTIDLVVQTLPPMHDAIGEYTGYLACELGKSHEVRVLTSRDHPVDALDGVEIETCFSLQGSRRFDGLEKELMNTHADAVVLQYNPFAWGNRGWAADLVGLWRLVRKAHSDLTLAVMFHETFMMNPGVKSWVMRQYQKPQFYRLATLSDISFFSTGRWAHQERKRRSDANILHLPVGSNLPESTANRIETRMRWGINSDDFVCGVFGGAHPSRLVPWIVRAIDQLTAAAPFGRKVVLLHVGGDRIDWNTTATSVIATGRLPAGAAADAIATMDVLVNPLSDGFGTRRGSAIAALQHAVPVLSTYGASTDEALIKWNGLALFLSSAKDSKAWSNNVDDFISKMELHAEIIRGNARRLYDDMFTWKQIAERMLDALSESRQLNVRGEA